MRTVLIAIGLAVMSAAALAQQFNESDPRSNIHNNESLRRQDEIRRNEEAARNKQHADDMYGWKPSSPQQGGQAGATGSADFRALGKELLRLPPLPVERNGLLGTWRVEGGGQQSKTLDFGLTGKGATPGMGELMGFMKSIESGQLTCDMSFGRGVTFTPTTFSSGGAVGIVGGPVAYRSRKKQAIWAIPGDTRANPMLFDIVGPDRIVAVNVGCALVRVGAAAANAAANAMTASASARTASIRAGAAMTTAPDASGAVVDGAAFRCRDGSLLHVSMCQGDGAQVPCKLTELHLPGLQIGKMLPRADIAARVRGCEAGGIRYDTDSRPVFVR